MYTNLFSNMLVNRIKPFMNKIIFPCHNVFVPKGLISDNIQLAYELLHIMKSKKCKTRYMTLKINLEKVYDRLEWTSIRNVLIIFNFSHHLIN